MNSIPDDELLSAYLDGELSDEERARVEQMLAEQPEARQLLDDLRALRGSFEGLPRHRLEGDFAARVLRAAERELLAGDGDGETPASAAVPPGDGRSSSGAAVAASPNGDLRPAERRGPGFDWARWRRPIAWAGAALAAGLLLMVVDRRPPPGAVKGPIAQAPADLEFRAPAEAAPPAARDRESRLGESAPADALPPLAIPEEKRSAAEEDAAGGLGGRMPSRNALGAKSAGKPESFRATASAPASAPRAGAAPGGAAPAKPGTGLDAGTVGNRLKSKFGLSDMAAGQTGNAYFYFKPESQAASEPLDPNALIILCDVAENVAARPEFSQLLLQNGIAWEAEGLEEADEKKSADEKKPAEESAPLAKSEKAGAAPNDAAAGQKPADTMRRFSDKLSVQQQTTLGLEERQQIAARNQSVVDALNSDASDYVLLEATDEQLKAVLVEFDRHPELFLSVNVEPAPEVPSQQAFSAYNRGNVSADKSKATAKTRGLASTPELKASASGGESRLEQLAREKQNRQLGRAQRVVLQQAEPALDSFAADKDNVAAGKPPERSKSSDAKEDKRVEEGLESLPARKAGGDQIDRPAGGEPRQGYQQALIILRRVPSAAAARKAEDAGEKKHD